MPVEKVDTVVVGGGQAGIAMSEHLTLTGTEHVVLERARVAERWRSARWDSLAMNGPAWHDRFPNRAFDGDPDGFPGKESVADYFCAYAEQIAAPVRCGVEVERAEPLDRRPGFHITTSEGQFEALNIVAATGPFQQPVIPQIVPERPGLTQLHSNVYRNPQALPEGAVLVVGAGSSGSQIAEELARTGRRTYLSVGPHERPPRSYRGRDFVWWLGVLGKWDHVRATPGQEHVTIAVSGARGGRTVDFRRFASEGITLLGMTQSHSDGVLTIAADLHANIVAGDASYLALLDEADAYVAAHGPDLPEEPAAREFEPMPECVTQPTAELDLGESGITSIIWATGYRVDYGWLKADVFDDDGRPIHLRGVAPEPGVYFLGLPWQSRRGSSFIWGVWHDARHVADQIAVQRAYRDYRR